MTCHLSSYFMVETNHNHLCLVTVFTIVIIVVVVDDDNDDAFDYAVVLHLICFFMKPTLSLKCSGSYGIYLVHC